MHSQLRERIRLMRARLDNAAPVAEIRAESQLFVSPAPICDRLVTLAEISNRDHILEPSAGTGAILRAILAVRQLHRESQEVAGGSLKKVIAAFPRAIVVAI